MFKCDHVCLNVNCGKSYSFCKNQRKLCCNTCELCLNCSSKTVCKNFILHQHMDIAKTELRNCTMHITNDECDNSKYDFPQVKDCKNWNDVLNKFDDTLQYIINYLHSTNYIISIKKDEVCHKIGNIQTGKALYKAFEKAVETLISSERNYEFLVKKVAENTTAIQQSTQEIQQTRKETQQNTEKIHYIKKEIDYAKSMHRMINGQSSFKTFTVPI